MDDEETEYPIDGCQIGAATDVSSPREISTTLRDDDKLLEM